MDYKETLNLPQTDFPMKANLAQREPEMLKKWEEMDIYKKIREAAKGKKPYILHDGQVLMEGRPHEVVAHEGVRRVYLGERFSL